jgi:GT2 family glycosyltransferase
VVITNIGRSAQLERCVGSIVRCDPAPDQVLVVDQSPELVARAVVRSYANAPIRHVPCAGRGIATGTNLGLRCATSPHVLVTHDDCTVAPDWIAAAARHVRVHPRAILTGRVMPVGDPLAVPSTKVSEISHDYTGDPGSYGALYPANMLLPRDELLAFGAFDERRSLRLAAEDNDLCYRWLSAGRELRYEPDLVVFHHDWRSREQLAALYVRYARGQGAFYAKHLISRDPRVARFLWADVKRGVGAMLHARRHSTEPDTAEARGILRGLPVGLATGTVDELRTRRADRARGSGRWRGRRDHGARRSR